MPITTLKIENARYILTIDPQRRIIRDGSVVIEGQRISQIGKARDLAGVIGRSCDRWPRNGCDAWVLQWTYAHKLCPCRAGNLSR